ncbi:alginate lyase family protein [Streptomyces boluensis]|uniref:Alginate lyase domain-containing protein n=1 Tax=Streptomyces boluensis TaxID=1775135 RepID=A0A964UUN1_9ACTN|nr:alginate lyase family protein [Streptomyces boluensis]NBE51960.1 hypothetical protein [Streptomyces boluensis]
MAVTGHRTAATQACAALLAPLLVLLVSCSAAAPRTPVRIRPPGRDFRHPGVLVDRAQLDLAKQRVAAGDEPWTGAYRAMARSRYADDGYQARPERVVECPPDTRPGHGCVEEREDAVAAYTQALLWYVTGDVAHAVKATEIMDSWSAEITDHTEGNAGLQTAWAGSTWARTGEIVRATYEGWPKARAERFARMLRQVYLPEVAGGKAEFNGNWDLTMADAALGIAVFLDDHEAFDEAVQRFRKRVPAYFYLHSDGPLPKPPPDTDIGSRAELVGYWFGQSRFPDGIAQETCRNFKHIGYALAATAHIAETAWHQGVDLYGEIRDRLDVPVPQAHRLVHRMRPAGTDDLFVAWETLTHADSTG